MLDRKIIAVVFAVVSAFTTGCTREEELVVKTHILIIGAIVYAVNAANNRTYIPEYRTKIEVDDTKCDVSEEEIIHIIKNINLIKIGMKRAEIEKILGIDTMRKRIVITGTGDDLADYNSIYYLGNQIGIEMQFNEFNSVLNKPPKLLGSNWPLSK